MRYVVFAVSLLLSHVCCAATTYIQFTAPDGKVAAVRISAIQMVVRAEGRLEISTASQLIRAKVNPDFLGLASDLDITSAAYYALLRLMEGDVGMADKEKISDWIAIVRDKAKMSAVRLDAAMQLIVHRPEIQIDCIQLEIERLPEKG